MRRIDIHLLGKVGYEEDALGSVAPLPRIDRMD